MRNAMRHNDNVALGKFPRLSVTYAAAAKFIGGGGLRVHRFPAGDKCRRSLEYVDHVRILGVDLCLTGLFAAAGVDHVIAAIASVEQNGTFGECLVHFVLRPVRHCRCWITSGVRRRIKCLRTGDRELLVLVGSRSSTHAHAPDNLASEYRR